MWLWDKKRIWITAIPNISCELWKPILLQKGKEDIYDEFAFNSSREAYEKSIEFCLKNIL